MDTQRMIDRLERYPKAIAGLVERLPGDDARRKPPGGARSILEIVSRPADEEVVYAFFNLGPAPGIGPRNRPPESAPGIGPRLPDGRTFHTCTGMPMAWCDNRFAEPEGGGAMKQGGSGESEQPHPRLPRG